ncbi:MAG: DUF4262 domain-containing protein [Actinomycetota bacterium]|jgi:hypothetical protein|nr:DUF4262 domain-containing protein [Actinomycetota bacterium]
MGLEYEPMEHMEKLEWMLENRGWGVEPVPPVEGDEPRAGYSYTFGLEALCGQPEVVLFGLAPAAAGGLLELIVGHLEAGGELPVGQPFNGLLDNGLVSALLEVERGDHGHLFPTLSRIYADQPWRVRQFVWPDRSGALPWDQGWPEQLRLAQPVIGHF